MGAIFTPVYPDELQISVPRIQILIDSYRERKRTGVIRLGYSSTKNLHLLIKRGELINTYLVTADKQESLDLSRWGDWVESAGDACAKVIPLSSYGLFVSKLLIASESKRTETFSRPNQLSEYVSTLGKKNDLTLVHLNWQEAMGCVFFPGLQDESHSLFLSHENIIDESGINNIFFLWNDPQCTVTTILPDLSVAAWQEYYLRKSFSEIYGKMLSRFETMTGRALVDSLVRLVAIFTSRNNLDIVITSRKLMDREVFSSPQDAAQAYHQILNEVFKHFSAIVGPRLLSQIMREIMAGFSEHERQIIHTFDLIPEGFS